MADSAEVTPVVSSQPPGKGEQGGGEGGGGLTDAQTEVLERCLHALRHAKNDSHTLAALLLITRLCPASQLDKPTLRRIFEAVGLNLPARLLVTAVRGNDNPGLPPHELLSLGTALLAALSTDPDMASHPQLLTTVPLLLGVLSNGPVSQQKQAAREESVNTESNPAGVEKSAGEDESGKQKGDDGGSEANKESTRLRVCEGALPVLVDPGRRRREVENAICDRLRTRADSPPLEPWRSPSSGGSACEGKWEKKKKRSCDLQPWVHLFPPDLPRRFVPVRRFFRGV
ncbi:uncharacterized protein LOC118340186 [Morone saxatilis]|uniref:uncharacterized protein LOC118340186 n=1 Tax=Morone saxatilis TaxID=34816 RepID=UPI0015E2457B|nr:uncharacterized protein LOC118340186 [Morone saxatilis]